MTSPVEVIPDDDSVHRWVIAPRMWDAFQNQLIWNGVWEFKRDHNCCESLVWNKYVSSVQEVHELGRAQEKKNLEEKPGRDYQYVGFLSANVGGIRAAYNARGHGFRVEHEPSEGIYHAHICYAPARGQEFTKNDKSELKLKLKDLFTEDSFRSNL